jgi:hypothetical protein
MNLIERLKCDGGIGLVHELTVVVPLQRLAGVSENARERIIEKGEVAPQIDLVKAVGNILDEHAVALMVKIVCRFPAAFRGCGPGIGMVAAG